MNSRPYLTHIVATTTRNRPSPGGQSSAGVDNYSGFISRTPVPVPHVPGDGPSETASQWVEAPRPAKQPRHHRNPKEVTTPDLMTTGSDRRPRHESERHNSRGGGPR